MATCAQKDNFYLYHIITITMRSYTTGSNLYNVHETKDIKRAYSDVHDLRTATFPYKLTGFEYVIGRDVFNA